MVIYFAIEVQSLFQFWTFSVKSVVSSCYCFCWWWPDVYVCDVYFLSVCSHMFVWHQTSILWQNDTYFEFEYEIQSNFAQSHALKCVSSFFVRFWSIFFKKVKRNNVQTNWKHFKVVNVQLSHLFICCCFFFQSKYKCFAKSICTNVFQWRYDKWAHFTASQYSFH